MQISVKLNKLKNNNNNKKEKMKRFAFLKKVKNK